MTRGRPRAAPRTAVGRDIDRLGDAWCLGVEATALRLGVPLGTLRGWRDGRHAPNRSALALIGRAMADAGLVPGEE
mgnify:FL=1